MSWHHPPEVYYPDPEHVTLFLAGAVMTTRGVDQILAYPRDPEISEIYLDRAGRVASPGKPRARTLARTARTSERKKCP